MLNSVLSSVSRLAAACQPGSGGNFLSFPTWYKYLPGEQVGGRCTPQFSLQTDIGKILLAIIEIMLRVGGMVAVVFVIYGGIRFIISQGEPDKAKEARRTIINALIGLVISMVATTFVALIGRSLI